jgi:DNA-binding transcriptional ArsR family regulator
MSISWGSIASSLLARSGVRKAILFQLILKPMTPSEIASVEKKHLSHVSRALSEMRRQGLVEYHSAASSRERLYKATELGYMALVLYMRNAR